MSPKQASEQSVLLDPAVIQAGRYFPTLCGIPIPSMHKRSKPLPKAWGLRTRHIDLSVQPDQELNSVDLPSIGSEGSTFVDKFVG
jgi:hypothetical protein